MSTSAPQLSIVERKALRAQAHALDPVVAVGAQGLTEAVLKETDAALAAHGLIKLRVHGDDRAAREAMLATICERLGAAAVQHIGKLLVLYRPKPEVVQTPTKDELKRRPRTVRLVDKPKSPTHRPRIRKVTVFGNERVTAGGTIKRAKPRQKSVKKKA